MHSEVGDLEETLISMWDCNFAGATLQYNGVDSEEETLRRETFPFTLSLICTIISECFQLKLTPS